MFCYSDLIEETRTHVKDLKKTRSLEKYGESIIKQEEIPLQ